MKYLKINKTEKVIINDNQRKEIMKQFKGITKIILSKNIELYCDGYEKLDNTNCFVISNVFGLNFYVYGTAIICHKRKRSLSEKELQLIEILLKESNKQ